LPRGLGYKAVDLDYGGWTELKPHADGEETLWLEDRVEPALRRAADLEIDTSVPVEDVVQRLVELVRR
jgi:hypothetical protein